MYIYKANSSKQLLFLTLGAKAKILHFKGPTSQVRPKVHLKLAHSKAPNMQNHVSNAANRYPNQLESIRQISV